MLGSTSICSLCLLLLAAKAAATHSRSNYTLLFQPPAAVGQSNSSSTHYWFPSQAGLALSASTILIDARLADDCSDYYCNKTTPHKPSSPSHQISLSRDGGQSFTPLYLVFGHSPWDESTRKAPFIGACSLRINSSSMLTLYQGQIQAPWVTPASLFTLDDGVLRYSLSKRTVRYNGVGTVCGKAMYTQDVIEATGQGHIMVAECASVTGSEAVIILDSTDDPFEWDLRASIDGLKNERCTSPGEATLSRLQDSRLLLVVRCADGETLLSWTSVDHTGAAWTTHRLPDAMRGVMPTAIRMDNGAILLATGRGGLALWFNSLGDGASWEKINVAQVHNALIPKNKRLNGSSLTYTAAFVAGNMTRETTAYNTLLKTGPESGLICYDRLSWTNKSSWHGPPGNRDKDDHMFCMSFRLTQERGESGVNDADCKTDADCNYAGVCNASYQCSCDVSWAGSRCERLNLLPAARSAIYPSNANTPAQKTWTWGGAAITGDDGKVHMFVTEWMNNCPMDYPSFATQTHIIHVVGDTADGPFERVGEVVPVAAGNPVISRASDGTFLLYFTNYRYNGPVKNCSNRSAAAAAAAAAAAVPSNLTAACGIHLAHSRDLKSWSIVYDIAFGSGGASRWDNCTLTNPGPFVFPNNSVLMMFKLCRYPPYCAAVGNRYDGAYITGLLTSPLEPDAQGTPPYLQPYTRRVRADPLINTTKGNSIEDPSNGWIDSRGTLHMLVHVGQNRGGAMHSIDGGVDWHYNLSSVSYPTKIAYQDGKVVALDKRQEPKVLLGADGLPTHLINICGTHGLGHTYVCLQPICTHELRATAQC